MKLKNPNQSSTYIESSSKDYAIYVAQNRSIPHVTDGLKDGQRKALWVIRNKTEKIKTVSLSGVMISEGIFHHGDVSASDTISGLAATWMNNIPLLEGIGNFGTRICPHEWGAPRYTYVKKYSATERLIYVDLDLVPVKENYDGSNVEPIHFLPLIPMVLLNGVSGIAVGWSTDCLPHALLDLITACKQSLNGQKIKKISPRWSKYKCDVNNIEGQSWELLGKVTIKDASTAMIEELPPDMNIEKVRDRLNELEDQDQIKGWTDRSTDLIRIEVDFKRNALKDRTPEDLALLFKLRQRVSQRLVTIGWNSKSIIQWPTPEQLIEAFVAWRLTWYKVRYEKLLETALNTLALKEAIVKSYELRVPNNIVANAKHKGDAIQIITDALKDITADTQHIETIASIPTYRWNTEYIDSCKQEIKQLKLNIKEYKSIISRPEEQKKIYLTELDDLAQASKAWK